MNPRLLFLITAVWFVSPLSAQEEPSEPSPVTLTEIKIEKQPLPGSGVQWGKIVILFESKPAWADGIVLAADVLLKEGERFRIASGVVRYSNIPRGTNRGFLYMSPSALRRFGEPVAVNVTAFYQDQEAGELRWQAPGGQVPDNWNNFNRFSGIITDLLSTPWIMIDYDKAPDIRAGR